MSFRTPTHAVIIGLLVLLAAGFVAVQSAPSAYAAALTAQAQETPTPQPEPTASAQIWEEPVNLSQSGAASSFRFVVDHTGLTHIIWQETGAEAFIYTHRDDATGGALDAPLSVELPFGTAAYDPELDENDPVPLYLPKLVATTDGRIHAFWINDDAVLQYSSVPAELFADFSAWQEPQDLAQKAVAFDVTVGAGDQLHLLYISALNDEESTPGVYYLSRPPEEDWLDPLLVYGSLYLRTITPAQANIQLAADNTNVVAVWDNPLIDKVFMVRSTDGGQTWPPAREVDGRQPTDADAARGPSRITLTQAGPHLLLLWQAGHDGVICGQYYQTSPDAGTTWSPRTLLQSSNAAISDACTDYNQLLASPGTPQTPIFLLTANLGNSYLLAWTANANVDVAGDANSAPAGAWSEAIPQPALDQFVNASTNQLVKLGCHQARITAVGQIILYGCGQNASGASSASAQGTQNAVTTTGDVWLTRRDIGATEAWFPAPAAWSRPAVAAAGTQIQDLDLVTGTDGRLHIFWSQAQGDTIYYAFSQSAQASEGDTAFSGGTWSQALPVLTSSGGIAREPSAAFSPQGRLLVVWSDPGSGAIYFSKANPEDAANSAAWSTPTALVESNSPPISPQIVIAPDETYYVTFAIPFNEGRGIYVTHSTDHGQTWSAPTVAYDGQGDHLSSVGQPDLLLANSGVLHLMWRRQPLLRQGASAPLPGVGSASPATVLQASSVDGGQTWTAPEIVIEGAIAWSGLTQDAGGRIYLLWQQQHTDAASGGATEASGVYYTLHFQTSSDAGRSWNHPGILADAGDTVVPVATTRDDAGNVHLVQLTGSTLKHWIAEAAPDDALSGDAIWLEAETYDLAGSGEDAILGGALAVAVAPDNRLLAAYTAAPPAEGTAPPLLQIAVTGRALGDAIELAEPVVATPPPLATPVGPVTTTAAAETEAAAAVQEASSTATPTRVFPTEFEAGSSALPFLNTSNRWLRVAVALIPVALIVFVVLAIRVVFKSKI